LGKFNATSLHRDCTSMINKAAMSVSKTVSVSLIIFQVLLFGFVGKKSL